MKIAAVDLETYLIEPHNKLPRIVCMSWATDPNTAHIETGIRDAEYRLLCLLREGYTLVAHYGSGFDFPIMLTQCAPPTVDALTKALADGRALCTKLWARMADIAKGDTDPAGYALAPLCKRFDVGIDLDKSNPWRLRYAELDGVPLSQWPREAVEYSLDDARALYRLASALPPTKDVDRKTEQHTYLALSSARGAPIDMARVNDWACELVAHRDSMVAELIDAGILRDDETRDMARVRALLDVPGAKRTAPSARFPRGQVSTNREACEDSPDPIMQRYSEFLRVEDSINRELSLLLKSGGRVHTRYGLADSGRTTSSDPALQNIGNRSGARKAFIAEPGKHMGVGDFSMLELSCIAQVCVASGCGDRLAAALRSGADLHTQLGERLAAAGIASRESDPKYLRRLAKEANFGFNGGMGERTLMATARKRGIIMSEVEAATLKRVWKSERPDVLAYHRLIQEHLDRTGGVFDHYRSGRVRGGLTFTQAANTGFQGLGGDVALEAFVACCKAGYMPQLFVHDEYHWSFDDPGEAETVRDICNRVSADWLPAAPSKLDVAIVKNWSEKK